MDASHDKSASSDNVCNLHRQYEFQAVLSNMASGPKAKKDAMRITGSRSSPVLLKTERVLGIIQRVSVTEDVEMTGVERMGGRRSSSKGKGA
jgi:hypothetical protein